MPQASVAVRELVLALDRRGAQPFALQRVVRRISVLLPQDAADLPGKHAVKILAAHIRQARLPQQLVRLPHAARRHDGGIKGAVAEIVHQNGKMIPRDPDLLRREVLHIPQIIDRHRAGLRQPIHDMQRMSVQRDAFDASAHPVEQREIVGKQGRIGKNQIINGLFAHIAALLVRQGNQIAHNRRIDRINFHRSLDAAHTNAFLLQPRLDRRNQPFGIVGVTALRRPSRAELPAEHLNWLARGRRKIRRRRMPTFSSRY